MVLKDSKTRVVTIVLEDEIDKASLSLLLAVRQAFDSENVFDVPMHLLRRMFLLLAEFVHDVVLRGILEPVLKLAVGMTAPGLLEVWTTPPPTADYRAARDATACALHLFPDSAAFQ